MVWCFWNIFLDGDIVLQTKMPPAPFRKKLAKVAVGNHAYSFRLRAAYWPSKCNRESKRLKKLPTKSIWKESGSIQTLIKPWFWSYFVWTLRLNFSLRSTNIYPPKFQKTSPPLKGHDGFNFFRRRRLPAAPKLWPLVFYCFRRKTSRDLKDFQGGHLGTSNGVDPTPEKTTGLGGQWLAERNALSIAAGSSVLLGAASKSTSFEFVGSQGRVD